MATQEYIRDAGAEILLLVREGKIIDWISLCEHFGIGAREHNSLTFWIGQALESLVREGFLEVDGRLTPSAFVFPQGIRITSKASMFQRALGVSLAEVAKIKQGRTMVIEPFWGLPPRPRTTERLDLFVLMPFSNDLLPIYRDHIKKVARRMSLVIKRGDDFFTAHEIVKDVWRAVVTASVIVADCTGRNPNVFYEMGIAHTLGKPVILTSQQADDVPFDLRSIRYIKYSYTPPGMKAFEEALEATIREILPSKA